MKEGSPCQVIVPHPGEARLLPQGGELIQGQFPLGDALRVDAACSLADARVVHGELQAGDGDLRGFLLCPGFPGGVFQGGGLRARVPRGEQGPAEQQGGARPQPQAEGQAGGQGPHGMALLFHGGAPGQGFLDVPFVDVVESLHQVFSVHSKTPFFCKWARSLSRRRESRTAALFSVIPSFRASSL